MGKLNRPPKIKYCACGCLREVKPGRRFIRGHNRGSNCKSRIKSIPNHHLCFCEECDMMVASDKKYAHGHNNRGKRFTRTEEQCKNISDSLIGRTLSSSHLEKLVAFWTDPEVIRKYAILAKERWQDPEFREKQMKSRFDSGMYEKVSLAMRAKGQDPEYVKMMSDISKQKYQDPEFVEMRRLCSIEAGQTLAARWEDSEFAKMMSDSHKPFWSNPENHKSQSDALKEFWADPENRSRQLLAMFGSNDLRPNKPESLLKMITCEYHPGFRYVGDFSFWVNGKNPDFVNEETKQIIEVYGDYWHDGEDPTDRAEIFAQAGYETCVIWENELKNLDHVIGKLRRFCEMVPT